MKPNWTQYDPKQTQLPQFLLEQLAKEQKTTSPKKDALVLELRNVDKIYDNGFQAIFGTNIQIKKGTFLSLLGPSGCGKSTTLRMIAGLEKVSQGTIHINGTNVTNSQPADRDLTMVFQNYALFPHLNVKNNIAFGLKANKKKLGASGIIYKQINLIKNQILELENRMFHVKHLRQHERKIQQIEHKLIQVNQKQAELAKIKTSTKKQSQQLKKYQIQQVWLNSLCETQKNQIRQYKKDVNLLAELSQKSNELKNKIQALEQKRKIAYQQEDQNKIIQTKTQEAAKILGLEYYLDRKPAALSGGQRQRVALGRSIVGAPTLFLMDEPLSNLDAKLRTTMRQEIRQLHERINSGTVYVTHDQIEAMTMSDQLAVMADGFILQIGSPNDVYQNPSCVFVAGFVGSPAMNLIAGTFQNQTFHTEYFDLVLPKFKTKHLVENQKILLGIRPTDFSTNSTVEEAYQAPITVTIVHKELLGNEIQYKAKIKTACLTTNESLEIVFITSAYDNFQLQSDVIINVIASRIHLFDQASTICLTSEFNSATILALKNWIQSGSKIQIRRELLEAAKQKQEQSSYFKKFVTFCSQKINNWKKEK